MPKRENERDDLSNINRLTIEETIRDTESLSLTELAIRLNRDKGWIKRNMIELPDQDERLPVTKFGDLYLISGRVFNQWLAARSKPVEKRARRAPTTARRVGRAGARRIDPGQTDG